MPSAAFAREALIRLFPTKYYGLCERFPVRPGSVPSRKSPRQILVAAMRAASVEALPAEPKCIRFAQPSAPSGFEVYFFLQGHSTVEVFLSVPFEGSIESASFAILAKQSWDLQGGIPESPPYPRPEPGSLEDLKVISAELGRLAELLASIAS